MSKSVNLNIIKDKYANVYDNCYIGIDREGYDPRIQFIKNSDTNITCEYDVSKINTYVQLNEYKNKYGDDYKTLLQTYCEFESDACSEIDKCSRLTSNDDSGSICKSWAAAQNNQTLDEVKKAYCRRFPINADCKCINRRNDKIYNETKTNKYFNDGCWYTPCTTGENLVISEINADNCPDVCQIIYDLNKNNSAVINKTQNVINCQFGTLIDQDKNNTTTTGDTTIVTNIIKTLENLWWIIVPSIAGISLLIIIIGVVLIRRRK